MVVVVVAGVVVVVAVVVVDDLNSAEAQLFTCVSKIFSVAPPDHLRLKLLTCASNTHLRPPPCLPQCHDLNSKFLFKLPPLAFHNAMI